MHVYHSSPRPIALALTLPLESPFGWRAESAGIPALSGQPYKIFSDGMKMTISFRWQTARASKFLAYMPIIGTIIGIWRIHQGIQEYRHFHAIHQHAFGDRSIYWIVRGSLEIVPVLGGSICLISDIVCTVWKWNAPTATFDQIMGSLCDRCSA